MSKGLGTLTGFQTGKTIARGILLHFVQNTLQQVTDMTYRASCNRVMTSCLWTVKNTTTK